MNCRRAQQWIGLRHDDRLEPARVQHLAAHLAGCAACREFAAQVGAVGAQLRAQAVPAGPTPEAAWVAVQRAIRLADQPKAPAASWWGVGPWVRWASAAALAVAVAIGGLVRYGGGPAGVVSEAPMVAAAPVQATEVVSVTTELAGASIMVYEDYDTGATVVWVEPAEDGDHVRM